MRRATWFLGGVLALVVRLVAQHAHLNAGAVDSAAGKALYFANGFSFVAESGYFLPLKRETNGPYAGHHVGSLTLTALPATGDNGGPTFAHALPGTRIEVVVEEVAGPAGGEFGFWDSDGFEDATQLTFSVPVGTRGGTNRFVLSENQGEPGSDPYGHIHGRRFSATVPGLYEVRFRLRDVGGNGPGGGPLHPPSDLFPLRMQAGVTVGGITVGTTGVDVFFAAEKGRSYRLQRRRVFATDAAGWEDVGHPVAGRGFMERVEAIPAGEETGWFRLRVD